MKKNHNFLPVLMIALVLVLAITNVLGSTESINNKNDYEKEISQLLSEMTVDEKIGQMSQMHFYSISDRDELRAMVKNGRIGSFLNADNISDKKELQQVAVEESRSGIPLIFGRDVIHGYRTVFPIPIGQASSWNPELVEKAARVAAKEAASMGIHWTFAPMIDIARDPRWGRIAESCGEDPFLAARLGAAMVRGFQGEDLRDPSTIAACGKHFVGYGAAEGGRDYNTAWIPERLLRNVYLKPFQAAVEVGVSTIMSAFNEINGVPASGNPFTLRQVLRKEWQFDGFVVSDWTSMLEMIEHGFCADTMEVAQKSIEAGVDMEMVSTSYRDYLKNLIREGTIPIELVDQSVKNILRIKFRLGLFENPYPADNAKEVILRPEHLDLARRLAEQSIVLLKNENNILPLSDKIAEIAVIGPLADSPQDQLGCWVGDGRAEDAVTPLMALRESFGGRVQIRYEPGLENTTDLKKDLFDQAIEAAAQSDAVLLFVGEEARLSGEAHSRAFLDLPGAQEDLVTSIAATGKPLILIIMAGRPLTFDRPGAKSRAILYAWHPGIMAGPALVNLIFGKISPSAKLPVTFPRTVGQIPIYYNKKNTGRPPTEAMSDIEMGVPGDHKGFRSYYLDLDFKPAYNFGFGLSYTSFNYRDLSLSGKEMSITDELNVSVLLENTGEYEAAEIVQLYIRDLVGSVTRPVKELKGFKRVNLKPGQSERVEFTITANDLAFWNYDLEFKAEPGRFDVMVGSSSGDGDLLKAEFELLK